MDSHIGNIMVLGTAASVGKSVVSLALCRLLHRHGRDVVPFKAMNVVADESLASDGEMLNIMQALQAAAADVQPAPYMNPVLFDVRRGSLQILQYGQRRQKADSPDLAERIEALRSVVLDGYQQAAAAHEFVVIEGCGSPVEMNIRDRDLSNLWLAEATNSACLVVADIERCGVFASLLGTLDLMGAGERDRVRGFIINKFHGSIDDFRDGIDFLERHAHIPCLGVIPRLIPLRFPAEDSLDLFESGLGAPEKKIDLGSMGEVYSTEIDRWTNHVFAHCDGEQLLELFGAT